MLLRFCLNANGVLEHFEPSVNDDDDDDSYLNQTERIVLQNIKRFAPILHLS